MRMLIGTVALVGLLQAGPVILSSDDIGDNYYDAPPAVIPDRTTWLGLFIKEGKSDQKTHESHLAVTSVDLPGYPNGHSHTRAGADDGSNGSGWRGWGSALGLPLVRGR